MTQDEMLKAISELHKPITHKKFQSDEIAYVQCNHCQDGEDWVEYPCPTIQAIQGQLSTEIIPSETPAE